MQDFRMDTFLTVCKYMNYTKAAKELNLTQPAVSQHIHFLEQTYGVELFAHNGKRMELTRAGEILKRSALTMKHDEFHMQENETCGRRRAELCFWCNTFRGRIYDNG